MPDASSNGLHVRTHNISTHHVTLDIEPYSTQCTHEPAASNVQQQCTPAN